MARTLARRARGGERRARRARGARAPRTAWRCSRWLPSSGPCAASSSPARAESRMTGMVRSAGSARMRLHEREAVEARHHHVAQDERRRVAPGTIASAAAPSPTASTVPALAQQPRDVVAHVGVVVGEDDARARVARRGGDGRRLVGASALPTARASSTKAPRAHGRRRQARASPRSRPRAGATGPAGCAPSNVVPLPSSARDGDLARRAGARAPE